MSRAPHKPNTQTAAERALWRKIRRTLSAERRRRRKLYALSSNREADLYIPTHTIATKTKYDRKKIIQFPR